MADNVVANAGSGGATFAADDIAGVHYPRTKLVIGADGTNDGDVASGNPLPVTGTVTANLAAGTNNIGDVDVLSIAAGDNNIGNVDIVTVPAPLSTTGAGTEAAALRVTVATDSTGVLSVDDNGGTLTVDNAGLTELAAAINASSQMDVNIAASAATVAVSNAGLTELAAAINASSQMDVNIAASGATVPVSGTFWQATQPVSAASLPLPSGAATEATLAARIPANGQALMASSVPVVIASNQSAVPVTDNSGSLTVDAPVGTPVFVRLSDGSAAIATLPVSLASVPSHAVTNAGTFATQVDGSALIALQKIDDPVLVDDAAFTPATSSVMMAGFEADEASTDSVDEGDAGAARMTLDRKQIVTPQPHTAGGLSIFKTLDLDETEEDVKTAAGQVYGWSITNFATAVRHIKFYNATAANVTVGTTTPVMTISVPGNATDDTQSVFNTDMGIAFSTAISVAATTGLADNDTGAPGASDVSMMIFYK